MRIKNSLRNFSYAVVGQFFNSIISFVCRTIFIHQLTVGYLGINSLFTNIMTVFSLAELGVGSAIFVYLFKPLADNDENRLKALTNFYASAFKIIGCAVAVIGVILMPFIKYIIKDQPDIEHLYLIYLIFVANSSISYFFSYKRAIITADQKEHICFKNSSIFLFIQYLLQIVILYTTKNYLFYLAVMVVCSFASNIAISIKANRLYPFLKDKYQPKLNKVDKRNIFKHVLAMMSHKVGTVVVNSTDNILISAFVGIYWVGLYSNYLLIQVMISSFVFKIFASMSASIGNLIEKEEKNKVYDIFNVVMFIGYWVFGFCSICFFILFNPFIKVWVGEQYLLKPSVVLTIVINYYLVGVSTVLKQYITVTKLFWNTKYKPWAEVAINLLVSIALLKMFGLIGVFIGTLVGIVTTTFWVDPYVLFKHQFNRSVIPYFTNYAMQTGVVIIVGWVTFILCSLIDNIFLKFITCAVVPNILFYVFYYKTKEFKYLVINSSSLLKSKV